MLRQMERSTIPLLAKRGNDRDVSLGEMLAPFDNSEQRGIRALPESHRTVPASETSRPPEQSS